MPAKTRAPRLSSEERREQILESAVHVVLGQGVARCTLESTAVEAGISKALIYRHFSSREELLLAVAHREYGILGARDLGGPHPEDSYAQILRNMQPKVFQHFHERGPIVRALFNDRSVVDLMRDNDARRRSASSKIFIDKIMETFAVPREVARLGYTLTMNGPMAAARALKAYHIDPAEAAEFWITFLIGGWTAISAKQGEAGD